MENRNNQNSDLELVDKIKKFNCETSLKILIERHTPLCVKVYEKYLRPMSSLGINYDEIYGDKDYFIYKSVLSFKEDKGSKFSTWLANQIRYQCLNLMNNKKGIPTDEKELNYFIDLKSKGSDKENDAKIQNLEYINSILDQVKDKRIKKLFKFRYFNGDNKNMSWNEVGKKLGISSQTAININNKVIKLIRRKLKSKELFDNI